VAGVLVEAARAKINLTLRVVGRRGDGYHLLESLVVFADLADSVSLEPGDEASLEVGGPLAAACGQPNDNLILKAAHAAGLPSGRFRLEKRIPVAAGLGGGSADAAAALRLMAKRNGIAENDSRLLSAARTTGADVPVCLASRPCVMRGVGDELSPPLELPAVPALLVNPGVALATADVFGAFRAADATAAPIETVPTGWTALRPWLSERPNDLTAAAIRCAPVIEEILAALAALPGCRLSRMSGSGATCFGLFETPMAAAEAARSLGEAGRNWWICKAMLG
jgi:4-diphosphocytidyl-2-C-methyl-D-erythritol kinase